MFDVYCKVLGRSIKHHKTGDMSKPCMFFQIGKNCDREDCDRSHDSSFQCTRQERQACEEQVKINAKKREKKKTGRETSQSGAEDNRKNVLCKYFNKDPSKNRCHRGEDCPWKHVR